MNRRLSSELILPRIVDGQTERQNNLSSDVRNADKLTDDGRSKRIINPDQ